MLKRSTTKYDGPPHLGKALPERPRKQVTNRLGNRQAILSATKPGSDTTREIRRIRRTRWGRSNLIHTGGRPRTEPGCRSGPKSCEPGYRP
jgi:hypothetical protein